MDGASSDSPFFFGVPQTLLRVVLNEPAISGKLYFVSYPALKPGGVLSITEIIGDPHYQSRSVVRQLAEAAGFWLQSIQGKWWFYTARFIKPGKEAFQVQKT